MHRDWKCKLDSDEGCDVVYDEEYLYVGKCNYMTLLCVCGIYNNDYPYYNDDAEA